MTDLEKLSAYLDNELNTSERTQLDERLAQDMQLQQALAKLEQSNVIARNYFSELDNKPMPLNLEAMILNAKPSNVEAEQKTAQIFSFPSVKVATWSFASAASILFAIGIWMLMPPAESNVNVNVNVYLLTVLNTEPSGSVTTINSELKVEVIASYKNQQGIVCRALIEHSPQSSNPAFACLKQGQWQIDKTDLNEHYQTASSSGLANKQGLMTVKQERLWLAKNH
ncbi:MAG: hypothetical protein ACI9OH_001167 [Oleispira sp.]|jgi:hypothetical protein